MIGRIHKKVSNWMASRRRMEAFRQEFLTFSNLTSAQSTAQKPPRFSNTWEDRYPCLDDRTSETSFDRHYIYHTGWAARKLREIAPSRHVDISSSLHFVSITSAFVPTDFYDFRPADLHLNNLNCRQGDLMKLPFEDRSVPSISCMHVVEHIGLGRYGDPFDPDGDQKALKELQRVVAPGGSFLFVTPVGRPKIRFNAHRIYSPKMIREAVSELTLKEFALLPDGGPPGKNGLIVGASDDEAMRQDYGCGCFWFTRPA